MFGLYARGVKDPEDVFGRIEHSLRETILEHGGSISHHHGVGKLRKDFMRDTLSDASIRMLKNFKTSNDPTNVFGIRNNVFGDDD
jgi:alkyldihydroxyacetonephosphate synthase